MTKKQARAIREQIAREYPFVKCEECRNGWNVGEGGYAHRCRCWTAHQAKVARLFEDRACAMDA